MKDLLHEMMGRLSQTLAGDVRDSYVKELESFNDNIGKILTSGFGLNTQDAYNFLQNLEGQTHSFCSGEMKTVFRS
jgi:hypothetical protein